MEDSAAHMFNNTQASVTGNHINSNSNGNVNAVSTSGEEIRTLYVVGLPDDIKERELRNLFRFYPAYRGCMLSEKKGKYGGTLAFALFESKAAALEAKAVLDNTPFDQGDPEGPKLSLHLAKKNINPRMLRETRLLTQQSVPSGYGVYTAHLHHGLSAAWNGYTARPQVYPPHNPGPIGYGAPAAPVAGPLSSSSASSILGIDGLETDNNSNSRAWHEHDISLNFNSAWTPPPPLTSPQSIRNTSDRRGTRTPHDSFIPLGSSSIGLRTSKLPTSF